MEPLVEDTLAVLERRAAQISEEVALPFFRAADLDWIWDAERFSSVEFRSETDAEAGSSGDFRSEVDAAAFLGIAKAIGASAIYCDARIFRFEEMIELIEEFEDESERKRRTRDAETLRVFDGQTEYLVLAFRHGDLWHTFQARTAWLAQRLELEGDEQEDDALSDFNVEVLSEDELESFAQKLSEHPAFEKLKTKGDQKALAEKLFAKERATVQESAGEIVGRARVLIKSK